MKKEDVFLAYKMLVQMKELSEKLDDSIKKEDFERANQFKQKILELQRSIKKIL
ncbi:MAG: UvrB/UvrC motif-containing protein [Candidatus Pacearchaeota archaeon]